MTDCIFCKIVAGELPCYKIYEDTNYLAFLDIFPHSEGHTLVIPKKHVEWVWDLPAGRQATPNVGEYFEVVTKIARHYRQVTGLEVIRSMILGWEVPHAHIHIKPGKENDWQGKKVSKEEFEQVVAKFKLG